MQETVRYTYRLRPGRQAEAALLEEWGRCRYLWNEAVHQQKTGRKPTFCKLSKLLTGARADFRGCGMGRRSPRAESTLPAALDHSFKVKGRGWP